MTWRAWFSKVFGGGSKSGSGGYRSPLSGPERLGGFGPPQGRGSHGYRNPLSALERLEAREVPATLTWAPLFGNTDWNTAANWSPDAGAAHVPTANDDVVFNNTNSGNCDLGPVDVACRTVTFASNFAGTLDLAGRTLTVDDGGAGLDNALGGGTVQNGKLWVYRGRLDVTGGVMNASLAIGPDNASGTATLYVSSNVGSLMATPSITICQGGTAQVIEPSFGNSVTLSANIEVKNGGSLYFTQSVDTVTMGNGGVITVDAGGLLDLASANVLKTTSGSYIDNYGTVQKTNSGDTIVSMGLKNEASTSLLVNSGGSPYNTAYLRFTDDVPGTTWSIIQTDGNIKLYNECQLWPYNGYKQDGGNLCVMGNTGGSLAALYAISDGEAAQINGGAVILSDGSNDHGAQLWSNMAFYFGASSELRFGISARNGCDLLYTQATVQITAGAKAVLTETVDNVGGKSWRFVRTGNPDQQDGITGTFTLDDQSGGMNYTLQKQNNNNDYYINT
jgi:hypothetical protein